MRTKKESPTAIEKIIAMSWTGAKFGAHILWFSSTGEYFETVEYELHRPPGVRGIYIFHFLDPFY